MYTFAASPEEALTGAIAAAGDKDVEIFSADIGGQLLSAGHINEIRIHLVPVLFGAGTRLFDDIGDEHIALEIIGVVEGSTATHLRYKVAQHS